VAEYATSSDSGSSALADALGSALKAAPAEEKKTPAKKAPAKKKAAAKKADK
jgi:hypothetical protein